MPDMTPKPRHARVYPIDRVPMKYIHFPDPVGLFIPRLGFQRCHRYAEVKRILAGEPHGPVVYFARIGRNVKIGTSGNLPARMLALYLSLDDVLAVVPGDKHMEAAYHHRFGRSRLEGDGRSELFRLDLWLRLYLARCRWAWHEVIVSAVLGLSAVAWAMPFTFGMVPLLLGALACAGSLAYYFTRPGWDWR